LDDKKIVNLYPGRAKPKDGVLSGSSGMFGEKEKSENSHCGKHTLPKLYNQLNALLPENVRSDKHFTGHTGKHTATSSATDKGVPIDDIRLTTNSSKEVLQTSYLKKHSYGKKLETSATVNTKRDEPDAKVLADSTNDLRHSRSLATELKKRAFTLPDSSDNSPDNSQSSKSTTVSAKARAYDKSKLKKSKLSTGAVVSSSSSSSSSMAQQPYAAAGPVFNFYNNCAPNPNPNP
jgi:hypothetical protein